MIKLVMFDWDGTIVDGLSLNYRIYSKITKRLGKKMPGSPEDLAKLTDGTWEELYYNLGIRTREEMEKAKEIYIEMSGRLKDEVRIFPGIRDVLSSLKGRGIRTAVISNGEREVIEIHLEKMDIDHFIDQIIAHEDSERIKPDPDQIHLCLERLGVKPEEAVFVGDMINDIKAARNAGLSKVIAVTYGWHTRGQLEKLKPDVMIGSVNEILENL
jgi:HAD superfamily hydrolase (TIGR01662 family)